MPTIDLLDYVSRIEIRHPDRPPVVIDEYQIVMSRLIRDGVIRVMPYEPVNTTFEKCPRCGRSRESGDLCRRCGRT